MSPAKLLSLIAAELKAQRVMRDALKTFEDAARARVVAHDWREAGGAVPSRFADLYDNEGALHAAADRATDEAAITRRNTDAAIVDLGLYLPKTRRWQERAEVLMLIQAIVSTIKEPRP